MTVIPNNLGIARGVTNEGATPHPQLMASDTPQIADVDVIVPAAQLQFVPLGPGYAAWAAGDPIIAVTMFQIVGTNQRKVVRVAGCFNIDAIRWPAGTTEAQIQVATEGSQLQFRKLLYSQKRTGGEVLGTEA